MRVSIVVPVYNEAAVLPELIEHLRAIRDDDCEAIVVDGGSTDGGPARLDGADVRLVESTRGRAVQMNAGGAAATGDLLLFLHADTRLPATALDDVRAAARSGADGGFFRVRLDSGRPLLRLVGRLMTLRSRWTGLSTGDQAQWLTRGAFDRLGGFAPLPLFEDVDLARRLKREGRVAALRSSVVTSARRWERAGAWRTILRMWALRARYALGTPAGALAARYGDIR